MIYARYLTRNAVERLRGSAEQQLDWYYKPNKPGKPSIQSEEHRETEIDVEALSKRLIIGRRPSKNDAKNALSVYQILSGLTPNQAADERFWVWVSHFLCAKYIAKRWLGPKPKDKEEARKKVQNHFFAPNARALIRDHGISRLWWLGHIAHKVHPRKPRLFLEIVLHRQDVRSALIERPSVSMNTQVLKGIFSVMRQHWNKDNKKEKAALFKREIFRNWMRGLNRRGGLVLMDALPEEELTNLLSDEAATHIEEAKPKGDNSNAGNAAS